MSKRIELSLGHHVDHVRDAGFAFLDVELERFVKLFGLLVVLTGTAPLRFSLVVLGNAQVLVNIAVVDLEDNLCVLIHLLMRLRDYEGVFSTAAEHEELDCFLFRAFKLAVVGDHVCALWQLALSMENLFGPVWVVKMVQVEANDIFPIICLFIGLLGFVVVLLSFFRFGNKHKDSWRGDLVHQGECGLIHANLNVDRDSLLDKASFLVQSCRLWPLFHLLADSSDFNHQILVRQLLSNLHASWHATHLNRSAGDSCIALSIVLLHVDPLVSDLG